MTTYASAKKWKKAHPEQVKAQQRRRNQRLRRAAITRLGDVCVRCGFSDERVLQIDHVNGNGRREQRAIGVQGIYRKIRDGIDLNHYQCLCANCNWIKRAEKGEDGHG